MRKQRFYLCSAFGMWFADEWPNSGAYLIRTLHLGEGGYSQVWKMHTPLIIFDSMRSMVTVLVHGSPLLFYQERNHKKLPKPLSGQWQTTDKNGKQEQLCEDWVHRCSFFPLPPVIIYVPGLWKTAVTMLKLPVPHFSMFFTTEVGKGKRRRQKLHGANSYLLFKA